MKIIVIEGLDGCGKTTVSTILAQKLMDFGVNTKYVHFPDYDSPTGKLIKKNLFKDTFLDMNPYTVHAMYALDRALWFENYKDMYKNHILIMDRYTESSMIYQTAQYIKPFYPTIDSLCEALKDISIIDKYNSGVYHFVNRFIEDIRKLEDKMRIPQAHITFWLDTEKDTISKRLNGRKNTEKDTFESNADYINYFAENVILKLNDYKKSPVKDWIFVDNNGTEMHTVDQLYNKILTKINGLRYIKPRDN